MVLAALLELVITAGAVIDGASFEIDQNGFVAMEDYVDTLRAVFGPDVPIIQVNAHKDFKPVFWGNETVSVKIHKVISETTIPPRLANCSWAIRSIQELKSSSLFVEYGFSFKDMPLGLIQDNESNWGLLIPVMTSVSNSLGRSGLYLYEECDSCYPVHWHVQGYSLETFYQGSPFRNDASWLEPGLRHWLAKARVIYLF